MPPCALSPVNARPSAIAQLPTAFANSEPSPVLCGTVPKGSVQNNSMPSLAYGAVGSVVGKEVHQVSSKPVSDQVLPAPQHSAQSFNVCSPASFVAVTDPCHTFKPGDGVILLTQDKKQSLAVGKVAENNSQQSSENLASLMVDIILTLVKTNPPLQGKSILWPKDLTAKPVRVVGTTGGVAANEEVTSRAEYVHPHPINNFQEEAGLTHETPQQTQQITEVEPVLPSPVSDLQPSCREDRIFNYGLQVIQLGIFLMQMDDTEREGDGERMMRN